MRNDIDVVVYVCVMCYMVFEFNVVLSKIVLF